MDIKAEVCLTNSKPKGKLALVTHYDEYRFSDLFTVPSKVV